MKKKQKWIVDWMIDNIESDDAEIIWFVYLKGTRRYLFNTGVVILWSTAVKHHGVAWAFQMSKFASKKLATNALQQFLGKLHGWVLKTKVEPKELGDDQCRLLKHARVFTTRKEARKEKRPDEIVYKVKLFKNGVAKKIIGRG